MIKIPPSDFIRKKRPKCVDGKMGRKLGDSALQSSNVPNRNFVRNSIYHLQSTILPKSIKIPLLILVAVLLTIIVVIIIMIVSLKSSSTVEVGNPKPSQINGTLLSHTGADLLPDTDFNLPLPMKSEICLMINFKL